MHNATTAPESAHLDDIRGRAAQQRIELAFVLEQLASLLEARSALLQDVQRTLANVGAAHVDWPDVLALWQLEEIDRTTEALAVLRRVIDDHLGA